MTSQVADAPIDSAVYANSFRVRRLGWFLPLVDAVLATKPMCRILDIGGEVDYWRGLKATWGERDLDITIVNISDDKVTDTPGISCEQGDARDLRRFDDMSFDIVHSNSVIEHVGQWSDMQAMAREVRRLAPAYFVQTPNFWFPLEPHLRVPFIHWLPRPLRRRIVLARACGFYPRAADLAEAEKILQDASLIDGAAMATLFPDAEVRREKVGPLTKSLIAIRAAGRGTSSPH